MKRSLSAALMAGFVVMVLISSQGWAIIEGIHERGVNRQQGVDKEG
jgi:hypothetical protein